MKLNSQQADLLHSLTVVIQEKWGIKVGYTCPAGAFLDSDDQFILYDSQVEGTPFEDCIWETQLLHHQDIMTQYAGDEGFASVLVNSTPREFPLHDEQVEKFWDRIQNALLSGEISFEPGFTRVIDGVCYEITKKADNRFDIQIKTPEHTTGFRNSAAELLERRQQNLARPSRDSQKALELKIPAEILQKMETEDQRILTAIRLVEEKWGLAQNEGN